MGQCEKTPEQLGAHSLCWPARCPLPSSHQERPLEMETIITVGLAGCLNGETSARYSAEQLYLKRSYQPCCQHLGKKNFSGTSVRSKFIYREKKLPGFRT